MHAAVLVTYASRYGSTAEVAEGIARELGASYGCVDVAPVQRVRDLRPYRAVVLGSAVRSQRWLPEALAFLSAERASLRLRLFACFSVCGLLRWNTSEHQALAKQPFQQARLLVPEIRPLSVEAFAGRVPNGTSGNGQRLIAGQTVLEPGDWREWDAIRAWAQKVAGLLQALSTPPIVPQVRSCELS